MSTVDDTSPATFEQSNPVEAELVQRIDRALSRVGDLHSAPKVVQEILSQTRSIDFDLKGLTNTIASDPALSAKILRLVNSASFGLPRRVNSLPQAVMILGQRTLRLVVMTFSLVDKLTKGLGRRMYNAYWRQTLTMAIAGTRLSHGRTDIDADEAYASGLLADIGILVLAQTHAERYIDLFAETPHDIRLIEAERAAFGYDHAQVGSRLLERWGFSPRVAASTRYHHQPRPHASRLERTAFLSSLLSDILWNPCSQQVAMVQDILRAELNFDTDKLIELAIACKEQISQQAELYGVDVEGEIQVEALLDEARRLFVTASLETAMDFDSTLSLLGQNPPPAI
ncbi:HDOD domain-containing protein [bacterium]|nr:HDOD domain-containing protein [bacterium]